MENSERFFEQLKTRLKQPLPGEEAQFLMAPVNRERFKEISKEKMNPKKSAVLILIYPFEGSFFTMLIERGIYEGVHSGQIAFPGGRQEDQDVDLKQTALRETQEEIGIDPNLVEVVGQLSEVYIIPSNYLVSPFIGILKESPTCKINPMEVQTVFNFNLNELNNEHVKDVKLIKQSNGMQIKTPYYEIGGYTVWGATAMILSELNALLKEIISA